MTDSNARGPLDTAQILASVGEVAYEWHIDTDVLVWSANVKDALLVGSADSVATGRDYAQLLEAENAQARFVREKLENLDEFLFQFVRQLGKTPIGRMFGHRRFDQIG